VLLPTRNRKDLEEIPEHARKQLKFIWLDNIDDALAAALGTGGQPPAADTRSEKGRTAAA
jgi:ATP-dependent Lon protease